jgi:hypothetical protein
MSINSLGLPQVARVVPAYQNTSLQSKSWYWDAEAGHQHFYHSVGLSENAQGSQVIQRSLLQIDNNQLPSFVGSCRWLIAGGPHPQR